jgi:dolichol kinase
MFPILDDEARSLFSVALVGTFYTLFVLELLRYHYRPESDYAPKVLIDIWTWMKGFIDKRDQHLWVTHLSLFSGMMISYFSHTTSLIRNTAVVLPIGDASAAIIGSTFGRIKVLKK